MLTGVVHDLTEELSPISDAINLNFPSDEQMKRCEKNASHWRKMMAQRDHPFASVASVQPALDVVLEQIDNSYQADQECDILVTGSLHLIGAALTALKMESQVISPE